jgi:predicted O-methyltransferase YrrM
MSPNGIIIADNVLWSGKVIHDTGKDKEAVSLKKFNDLVNTDERVENILLPVRDGLMIIRKR